MNAPATETSFDWDDDVGNVVGLTYIELQNLRGFCDHNTRRIQSRSTALAVR